MSRRGGYADNWDHYVSRWKDYAAKEPRKPSGELVYPGDEWGTPQEWESFARDYLHPYLPADGSGVAVELGQGSGKYTLKVVERVSRIVCFDVSPRFLEIARGRLAPWADSGRLSLAPLELKNCYEVRDRLEREGLAGKVDLFFSVDAMVHVELHTLAAYWINAASVLRSGGHLAMTLATATSAQGFDRLLDEVGWCYGGLRASNQFFFLSDDLVRYALERLGFEIVRLDQPYRDLTVVARKVRDVEVAVQPAP